MSDDKKKWGKPCHIHAVRCPHCSKANDFREVADGLIEEGGDDGLKETRARPSVECDHCHGIMEVVKIQPTTLIWVRKFEGAASNHHTFQAGQTTFRCDGCRAEFYDSIPDTDNNLNPIAPGTCPNCGGRLRQA